MIFTERKITVRKGKSSIDEPVILYRGDYEVELRFTIMESKYRFKSGVNLVDSEKASHAQLALLAPDGTNVFTEVGRCEDGTAIFVLSKEMIDELSEVGLYSFQIRLFDYYRESRISIPPVEFGIEVREPIASEDHTNAVYDAMVGYSIAKTSVLDKPVGDTFDPSGQYIKTDWQTGDRISEGRLNKIEDALHQINSNEVNLDKRVTSNYNTLDSKKQDKGVKIPIAQIDKNLGKIDQTYLSEELIKQMAGDAAVNAVPADQSITSAKLTANCVSSYHADFIEGTGGTYLTDTYIDSFSSANMFVNSPNTNTWHMVEIGSALGAWEFTRINRIMFLDSQGNKLGVFQGSNETLTVLINEVDNPSYYNLFKTATHMSISMLKTLEDTAMVIHDGEEILIGKLRMPKLSLGEMQIEECKDLAVDVLSEKLGYNVVTRNHLGYCYPSNSLSEMVPFDGYFTTDFIEASYGDTIVIPYSSVYGRVNIFKSDKRTTPGGWTLNVSSTNFINADGNFELKIEHDLFKDCAYITVSARLEMYDDYFVLINGFDKFDRETFAQLDKLLLPESDSSNSDSNIIEGNIDITDILSVGGCINLGKGNFTCDKVTLPANTIIRGQGDRTIINFEPNSTGYMITMNNGCRLYDLVIAGGVTTHPTANTVLGDRSAIYINNKTRCRLYNVRVTGFSAYGLHVTYVGANQEHHKNLKINDCDFEFNYYGILFDTRAEYIQTVNTACGNNFFGCVNRGGNNLFSNCMFNSNVNGFMVEGGSAYPNHGHSSASNCSFNHNVDIALIAKNVTIGYIFNGCQLFDGDLVFDNSTGIWFTNGELGTFAIRVNGGECNLIENNFFYTSPSKSINGGKTVIENNRLVDGTIFS